MGGVLQDAQDTFQKGLRVIECLIIPESQGPETFAFQEGCAGLIFGNDDLVDMLAAIYFYD